MKRKTDTKLLTLAFGLIVITTALVMLALSTLTGQAQTGDDGYPAPVGYPEPFPWIGEGYPVDDPFPWIGDGYPVEVVSEPTEWQAEIEEVQEVIGNIQPIEKSKVYQTWQQVKEIVRHYVGKMLMFAR